MIPIGHGPFSHVYSYDNVFPKQLSKHLRQNQDLNLQYLGLPSKPKGWKHEDGSNMMIDALLDHYGLAIDLNNLDAPLKQIKLGMGLLPIRFASFPIQ